MMHVFWFASTVGAILFFAAGAVTVLLRQRGARFAVDPASHQPVESDLEMIEQAEAAIAESMRLQAIDGDRRDEIERLRIALAAAEQTVRHQQVSLDEQVTRVKRDGGSARELDGARGRAQAAPASLAPLRAIEQELRGEIARLERDLATARSTGEQLRTDGEGRAKRLASELDRSRIESIAATRDLGKLQERIHELEQQLAERTQTLRDLSTENEHLKGRVRDAEALRAEYVRLRTATIESEYLKTEIARLEQELRTMRIDALGAERPRPARGTPRQTTSPARSIPDSLSRVIERFADAGTRSIAIGDAAGFPLASSGNDGVALAAYAALLFESATRARQFLPVAAPAAIEIIDDQGARLSVWTFDVESERLLLANLAVTPVDSKRVETTLADLSAILAPTAVANRFT